MPGTGTEQKRITIDPVAIKKAASVYRAIYHPLRLHIIEIIQKAGKVNVTPIIKKLKLEQSLVSMQLGILRKARFLKIEREGRNIFYSVNYQQINRVSKLTEKLVFQKAGNLSDFRSISKSGHQEVIFTPTELKVIRFVCEQNTSDEIAQKLNLSKRTIEDYRSSVIKKMKAKNSVGILIYAVKNGLFEI
jgi:DNA-binding CsgD family transcriptional regulator/DNA-binding transcriptional ArsR family regulator